MVIFQHVVLIVVLALRIAIPEIPAWLATEMAKVEFQRREAIKNSHAPLMVRRFMCYGCKVVEHSAFFMKYEYSL